LNEHTPRIFLCHTKEDKPRVIELYHQLKEAGYSPWLDKYDLLTGQDWWTEIEKIISDPHNLVVVCLSCQSIDKRGIVQREITRALDVLDDLPEDTIYLMPARLEACDVPRRLSHLHWVDLFEPDGFENLRRALDFELGKRLAPFEPELLHIPAGEFLMGSDPSKDKRPSKVEQPQHHLSLPEYYIAKTPVTNAQYAVFAEATGCRKPAAGKEDHPVVDVTWHDAVAYSQWLSEATGKAYRLPSEAEWEKAARGTDGRIWPWGNQWDAKRCNSREGGPGHITPVGQYSPQLHPELAEGGDSPYGCVDMAGNVWEWTLSLWGKTSRTLDFKYPYDLADGREDLKASDNMPRVLRGGAFNRSERDVRCAFRYRFNPYFRLYNFGFRVVMVPGFH